MYVCLFIMLSSKIAGSLSSSSPEGRERVADVIVRLATVLQCVVTAMTQ